jgi:prevent-host-death family protein
MADVINVHEAKTQLSRLLDRVRAGEEIILAKAGEPYARLVPIAPVRRRPGRLIGAVTEAFFEPLPDDELDAWGQGEP